MRIELYNMQFYTFALALRNRVGMMRRGGQAFRLFG